MLGAPTWLSAKITKYLYIYKKEKEIGNAREACGYPLPHSVNIFCRSKKKKVLSQ
jgi:hypothetical protein